MNGFSMHFRIQCQLLTAHFGIGFAVHIKAYDEFQFNEILFERKILLRFRGHKKWKQNSIPSQW